MHTWRRVWRKCRASTRDPLDWNDVSTSMITPNRTYTAFAGYIYMQCRTVQCTRYPHSYIHAKMIVNADKKNKACWSCVCLVSWRSCSWHISQSERDREWETLGIMWETAGGCYSIYNCTPSWRQTKWRRLAGVPASISINLNWQNWECAFDLWPWWFGCPSINAHAMAITTQRLTPKGPSEVG